jgi:twinkle protein
MERYDEVRQNAKMPAHVGPERTFSQKFSKYLSTRGLSPRTLAAGSVYETSEGLIGFPFYQGYTLVNVKFLNLNPKPGKMKWWQMAQKHGTKVCFMGLQQLEIDRGDRGERKTPNNIYICEGEWDMYTLKECGINNAISVPMGAPSEKAKNFHKEFQYIHDDNYFKGIMKYVDNFYICVDADEPGRVLKEHLVKILGPQRCYIITYPEGYKDINDVLKGNVQADLPPLGKEGVLQQVQAAKPYPLRGIIRASQLKDDLRVFRNEGLKPGFGIGIPEIDYQFTIKRQHISFWTGIPGMGKSVFLRWYLTKMLRHNEEENMKFALFTPEQRPKAREIVKLAEVLMGKRYQSGFQDSMTDQEIDEIEAFIERHFFIVGPDRFNFESFSGSIRKDTVNTMQSIFEYIAHLAKTENIFGYTIDAFNKLEFEHPSHVSETKFISEILDYFIDFNEHHNIHGFIVAHPTKTSKDNNGNYTMPSLYDIKGSSAWHEKADVGNVIHRYKFQKLDGEDSREEDLRYEAKKVMPSYIKTEKLRFNELGHEGIIRMNIDPYERFTLFPDDEGKHLEHITEEVPDPDDKQVKLWDLGEDDPLGDGEIPDLPF